MEKQYEPLVQVSLPGMSGGRGPQRYHQDWTEAVVKRRNSQYYLAIVVSLTTFIVYFPALRNGFVNWDDGPYLLANPHIRSLDATFFKWAFFDFYASNWHPLTWISHALDYAFWGLNPVGHHLTNLILHAFNSALVVFLMIRLFEAVNDDAARNEQPPFLNDRTTLIAAGVTGLLFGLHPVHVESVAWVAERKDLLCALFFLISIMFYVKYAKDQGSGAREQGSEGGNSKVGLKKVITNRHYLLTLGLFILALMSKPMAVSLPVVLLILDWYPLNRIRSWQEFWSMGVEKLSFIAGSLVSSILTVLAQSEGGAFQTIAFVPLSTRLLVGAKALIAYLGKMILPVDLVPYYPHPMTASIVSLEYFVPIVLGVGITIICLLLAKKHKVWLSVWSYYVVTLLPVIGIVQVGGQSMADRYTYLPSLGPFLIMGLVAAWVSITVASLPGGRLTNTLISLFIVIFMVVSISALTVRQIGVWKNGVVLWSYVIEKEPVRVPLAYLLRGTALENAGRFDKAIEDYTTAITLDPKSYKPFFNRATAFENLDQFDKALEDYTRTIVLNPSYYEAFFYRGALYGKIGLYDKAIADLDQAIAIKPNDPDAYVNRGTAYAFLVQYGMALENFNKAIELDQSIAVAYVNRGKLFLKTGNREGAVSDFRKACELGNSDGCNALH